ALMTLTRCNEALVRCSTEAELLQAVCHAVVEAGGYRMSWVGYVDESKQKTVKPMFWAGHEEGYLSTLNIDLSDRKTARGPIGIAMRTGKPAVVRDILSDPSFAPWREEAAKRGYGSSVALPLVDLGHAYGTLCIYAAERDMFNEEEVVLLAQLAEDLSYGIKALRVRIERDHAETELRALARRLVQSQEDERRSIARELHDQTGQQLTFLKLLLDRVRRSSEKGAPPELEEAQKVASEIIGQVRSLSLSLRPGMLDDLGLLPALQWSLHDFTSKTKIEVDFKHSGIEREFSQPVGTAVYRIIQEALTNVARYAGVKRVAVSVRADGKKLTVQIRDQGAGFDPALLSLTSSGIRGSRERALSLGGEFTVESAPGRGTQVTVTLPLAQTRNA
ncbi:MAG: GAF domain-containing sensor histidine kinase, partial [Dehalococcoidia bacterium]|nr:GAF domain-containing sensor histidine kinase [Dehalococcoidia bacterium]